MSRSELLLSLGNVQTSRIYIQWTVVEFRTDGYISLTQFLTSPIQHNIFNMTKDDGGIGNVLQIAEKVASDLAVLNKQSTSTTESSSGTKRKVLDDSVRIEISHCSSVELKPIVEPLIKQLESIDAAELLSLKPTRDGESGATLDSNQIIEPIHDLIKPQYQNQSENNIVRYLHVKEIEHRYSAGIFVFPPNTCIPLHDHPDMVVISRILYGELYVTSYDVMPSSSDGEDHHSDYNEEEGSSPTSRQSPLRASFRKIKDLINRTLSYHHSGEGQRGNILHAKPNVNPMNCSPSDDSETMIISAPKVTCLYPHEGNCHSFRAGPHGVAVLDVLLPPYSDGSRDCTFYEKNIVQEHNEDLYTLAPIEQPEDFHCVGGSYGKFGDRQHHDIGIDNV